MCRVPDTSSAYPTSNGPTVRSRECSLRAEGASSLRMVKIGLGVVALAIGAAAVAGATVGLIADRGADDFFLSNGDRFERSSFAITSRAVDVLTVTPGWVADRLTDAVDIRVKGSSNDGSSLFVGIGATDDVEAYLAGVAYDEVDAIRFDGSDVDYLHHSGTSSPRAPGREILGWPR